MKDVVYWSVEAQNAVQISTLRKSWCKLLNTEFEDADRGEKVVHLLKYFKKIPGCETVTEDIQAWVKTGDDDELDLSDGDIADYVLGKNAEIEDQEAENDTLKAIQKASTALETSLNFLEEKSNGTPQELLTLRIW